LIKECINDHCQLIRQNNTAPIILSKKSEKPLEKINNTAKAAPKNKVLKKQEQNISAKALEKV
jgi:hypothetical protein